MMNKEEQLMRKYHYGYIHSKKLLNEPYVKDLQQRIDKAIEYATKEMRIVNDNEYHRLLEILGGKE